MGSIPTGSIKMLKLPSKEQRLPMRIQLFIVMLFFFSFANMFYLMVYLEFPIDSVTYLISVFLGIGLAFTVYKLLYKLSMAIYSESFANHGEKPPKEG